MILLVSQKSRYLGAKKGRERAICEVIGTGRTGFRVGIELDASITRDILGPLDGTAIGNPSYISVTVAEGDKGLDLIFVEGLFVAMVVAFRLGAVDHSGEEGE